MLRAAPNSLAPRAPRAIRGLMAAVLLIVSCILAFSSCALAASGSSPAPSPAPAAGAYESREIPRSAGGSAPRQAGGDIKPAMDVPRVLLGLAVVIGLIYLLRWAGRKMFAMPAPGSAAGAVQVLSRVNLSPRQQLLLIRLGRRIVLVANSGAQANPLCEVSDPDEVAELLAQMRQPATEMASTFAGLFGRAGRRFSSSSADPEMPDSLAADPTVPAGTATQEPAVEQTQQELGDLVEKVRTLSRNFK